MAPATEKGDSKKREEPPDPLETQKRAERRAVTTLRRYAVHNLLDKLWTLTYREGCEDPDVVIADVDRCMRRLRRLMGVRFPYAYVLEWHPGGHGLHVHIALAVWIKHADFVRAWENGICDVRWLGRRDDSGGDKPNRRLGAVKAAHYLTKYLSKGFEEGHDFGRHRYDVGRGFQPDRVVRHFDTLQDAMAHARDQYRATFVWSSTDSKGWTGPLVLLAIFDPYPPDSEGRPAP